MVGLAIAATGTYFAALYDQRFRDGVASIFIGLVLAISATVPARETEVLLIGKAADPMIVAAMMQSSMELDSVANTNGIMTTRLAPA